MENQHFSLLMCVLLCRTIAVKKRLEHILPPLQWQNVLFPNGRGARNLSSVVQFFEGWSLWWQVWRVVIGVTPHLLPLWNSQSLKKEYPLFLKTPEKVWLVQHPATASQISLVLTPPFLWPLYLHNTLVRKARLMTTSDWLKVTHLVLQLRTQSWA